MKKFLLKLLLIPVLIILTLIGLEALIRHIPNEYRYKKEYLDSESDSIELLFLGSSDAHAGFDPAYIRVNSFNSALPSLSYDYIWEIFKMYDWSNLKYIVLSISYPSLYYKLGQSSTDQWREKNYRIYFGIKKSSKIRSYAEIFNGQLLYHIERIFNYYNKKIDEINCTPKGFWVSSTSTPPDDLFQDGIIAAKRHESMREPGVFNEIKASVDSIIAFSQRLGCKVILCFPPVTQSYKNTLDAQKLDGTIKLISEIAKEQNCLFIDAISDSIFQDSDFFNGDHLNGNGAKKLTLIIDSLVYLEE